jgi:hypothetical protein
MRKETIDRCRGGPKGDEQETSAKSQVLEKIPK